MFCDYLRAPENAYLHKDRLLCKKLSIKHTCVFGCMCTCVQVPGRLEEGLRFLGAGVPGGYKLPYVGASSWTQVLGENSISPHYDTDSFFLWHFHFYAMCITVLPASVSGITCLHGAHGGRRGHWICLEHVNDSCKPLVGARNCTSALCKSSQGFSLLHHFSSPTPDSWLKGFLHCLSISIWSMPCPLASHSPNCACRVSFLQVSVPFLVGNSHIRSVKKPLRALNTKRLNF